jgi:hypothetical protein
MKKKLNSLFQIGDVVVEKYYFVPTLYGIIIETDPKIAVRWKHGNIERYSSQTAANAIMQIVR